MSYRRNEKTRTSLPSYRMHSIARLVFVVCVVVPVVSCQGPGGAGRPSPSDVVLTKGEVPKGFSRCAYSGTVDEYVQRIQGRDNASAAEARESWAQVRRLGASSAAIAGFGATQADCQAGIGHGTGRAAASWVIGCRDQEAARRVYEHGLLGFPTPAAPREQPELVVGVATGLGPNAWTLHLDRPAPGVYVALWQDREFVTFLVTVGIDSAASHQMALAVDNRMG
jgi:hypothetical protein